MNSYYILEAYILPQYNLDYLLELEFRNEMPHKGIHIYLFCFKNEFRLNMIGTKSILADWIGWVIRIAFVSCVYTYTCISDTSHELGLVCSLKSLTKIY